MSPEAKVFIPHGQEAAFKKAVDSLGGRVVSGIKEDTRWIPQNVTPHRLAEFIKSVEHSFSNARNSYDSIFNSLRFLSPARQEEILVGFYTERVVGLPNAGTFARFLSKLNNLAPFRPNDKIDELELQGLVDEYRRRLGESSLPVRIISDNSWPRTTLFGIDSDAQHRRISELPFPIAKAVEAAVEKPDTDNNNLKRSTSFFMRISQLMASSITETPHQLELGPNEEQNGNFHYIGEPLIDIYRAGACPIGETEKNFIIFIPAMAR